MVRLLTSGVAVGARRRKEGPTFAAVALMLLWVTPSALSRPCGTPFHSDAISFGRDPGEYFIRTDWKDDRLRPRKGELIDDVAEYFAVETGSTVLYMTHFTEKDLPRAEWRGPDPVSTLRTFLAAAGLELETPSPGFWVIGTEFWNENSATTIFARPLDPERQGFRPASEVGDMERALINQLPVREGCGRLRSCQIGVSYYWLQEEGPDTLLVQADQPLGSQDHPPRTKVFKVRLDRSGSKIKVSCLWASAATGPMLTDIAEDFDGDGVRDFVFGGGRYDYGTNEILSGRDGHRMLEFVGHELLVEKSAPGLKRLGVEDLIESYSDLRRYGPATARVLTYSSSDGAFVGDPTVNVRPTPIAPAERRDSANPIDDARRVFAAAVGGSENVRAYQLFGSPDRTVFRVELVPVRDVAPRESITPELVKAGFPARIWFRYVSPGYFAALERKKAESRH